MNFRLVRLAWFLITFLSSSYPERCRLKKLAGTNPEESFRLSYEAVRKAFGRILSIAGTDLVVEGLENIPEEPVLFVGNHSSYFDIVVTGSVLPQGAGFVSKDSLKKIPGIHGFMDLIHCLYLDRTDIKQGLQMIRDGISNLKSGYSMVIYPEGTRSENGELGEFKGGALKMAQRADVPIVLVACTGSRDIYENNPGHRIMPARVKLTFGKPFRISELPKEERRFAARYSHELLSGLLDEQRNSK